MVNFADPSTYTTGTCLVAIQDDDLRVELRDAHDRSDASVRAWSRAANVGLGTAQRILGPAAGIDPTLRTLARLGVPIGLRLEIVPVPTGRTRTVKAPPKLAGSGTGWSAGQWPTEDADYFLALLGAELRWTRRHAGPVIRSATDIGHHTGVAAASVLRLERPTAPHARLSTATTIIEQLGYRLTWLPVDAPWRQRAWTNPTRDPHSRAALARDRHQHGRHRYALYTAQRQDWTTPPDLLQSLAAEYGPFTLDAAAREGDQCAPAWLGPGHPQTEYRDALQYEHWAEIAHVTAPTGQQPAVWLNPPYGNGVADWLNRASATGKHGVAVCCLIPARTDTHAWHDIVQPRADEVRFLRGRVRYGDGAAPAPFPSAVVVFR